MDEKKSRKRLFCSLGINLLAAVMAFLIVFPLYVSNVACFQLALGGGTRGAIMQAKEVGKGQDLFEESRDSQYNTKTRTYNADSLDGKYKKGVTYYWDEKKQDYVTLDVFKQDYPPKPQQPWMVNPGGSTSSYYQDPPQRKSPPPPLPLSVNTSNLPSKTSETGGTGGGHH